MSGSRARLEDLIQARYERELLSQITKLQVALADERTALHTQKQEMEAETLAKRKQHVSETEKASRLRAMEKAIEATQKEDQKHIFLSR